MKVLCNREKLREGLAIANNLIPTKSPKPVLSNVCMVATEEALELLGTDMEVAVRYRIDDVKVSDPGTVVIPARVTLDFVRDLSGETVEFETVDDDHCVIRGGTDSCELVTADTDEYPVVARFEEERVFPILGGTFTKLVGRTAFAAAREQGRYAMHGVLTSIDDGKLRMVATDGRRLAMGSAPIDTGEEGTDAQDPLEVIVPTKGMQIFCRVIEDPLDRVQLHFGENQLGLKTKNAEVFARLLDGEFPRYKAVIPEETSNRMEANAELLTRKIRLVANVTADESRAVRLSLKKGQVELFGHSATRGEATAVLEVDFKGDPVEIAFNPDYVIDGLKSCEQEMVQLEFNERTSPGKFTLGESYIYVVMPITIDT